MNWVEEVLRLEVQKNVWLETDSRSEDCSTYSVDVIKTLVDLGSYILVYVNRGSFCRISFEVVH